MSKVIVRIAKGADCGQFCVCLGLNIRHLVFKILENSPNGISASHRESF